MQIFLQCSATIWESISFPKKPFLHLSYAFFTPAIHIPIHTPIHTTTKLQTRRTFPHLLSTTITNPKMAGNVDQDALVLQLLEFVPNATPEQASQYLSANNWDLDGAAASLMADIDEAEDDATADTAPLMPAAAASASASGAASQQAPPEYTGPRTLDGRPAPAYSGSSASASKKPQPKKKGLATLSSLGGGHGHDHEDDDSDEDYDDANGPRDTYAGGEKSGLALQDPNKGPSDPQRIINDLLAKAKS